MRRAATCRPDFEQYGPVFDLAVSGFNYFRGSRRAQESSRVPISFAPRPAAIGLADVLPAPT